MYTRKIAQNDASGGAYLCAATAVGTFCVIDMGKVIFHLDRTFGTFLFTTQAGDTSVCAGLAHNGTLLCTFTGHSDGCCVGYDLDKGLWAALYAKSTASAFAGNDACYAVFKADSTARANVCAVAKTQTAKRACAASGKQQACGGTA